MAKILPIKELMDYAQRKAYSGTWGQSIKGDFSDEGPFDFDAGAQEIHRQIHSPPEAYQDPANQGYVEMPTTEEFIDNDEERGPKVLEEMMSKRTDLPYGLALDELPDQGSPAYKRMMREAIEKQRGPKERT